MDFRYWRCGRRRRGHPYPERVGNRTLRCFRPDLSEPSEYARSHASHWRALPDRGGIEVALDCRVPGAVRWLRIGNGTLGSHLSRPLMPYGRVYLWQASHDDGLAGSAVLSRVPLANLDTGGSKGLRGRFALVRNGVALCEFPGQTERREVLLGDVSPDEEGNFSFWPKRGGPRVDKILCPEAKCRRRYVQASRFGEVN